MAKKQLSELEQRAAKVFGGICSEFNCLAQLMLEHRDFSTTAQLRDRAKEIEGMPFELMPANFIPLLNSRLNQDYHRGAGSLTHFVEQIDGPAWRYNDEWAMMDIAAGFAMYELPIKFNIGLRDLLGIDKADAPYYSANLLGTLATNGDATIAQLARKFGMGQSTVSKWLSRYDELGLVEAERFSREKGKIQFSFIRRVRLPNDEFKQPCSEVILAGFERLPAKFTYKDVQEKVYAYATDGYPQSGLRELERKGYVRCHSPWVGKETYSRTPLTQRGKQLVRDFVVPMSEFAQGNYNSEMENGETVLDYMQRKQIYPENIPRALAIESQLRA